MKPTTYLELLQTARHAPSSHNTQPWVVRVNNDGLIIGYDPKRHLKVGDPDKRELFISLGCFVQAVILAAEDKGYRALVKYENSAPSKVVALSFKKSTALSKTRWSSLIAARRSDRRMYERKRVPPETLQQLETLTVGKSSFRIFSDKGSLQFLSDKTAQATLALMTPQSFREELAYWVRHNWTKKPDGMPGYTQGMPGPVSLLAKFVIRKNKRVANDQAKKDSKRILNSSAIGIITVSENTPPVWIDAGRLYLLACLKALEKGIKTSAISASIIWPESASEITHTFKLKGTPVALIRLGYTKGAPKQAPRLKVSDFTY